MTITLDRKTRKVIRTQADAEKDDKKLFDLFANQVWQEMIKNEA